MGIRGQAMNIAVLGLWHLGCVYASGAAMMGHSVRAWDGNKYTIERLSFAEAPLFEPGLDDQIREGINSGTLQFTSDFEYALSDAEVLWITFDTPVDDNDVADNAFVYNQVRQALPYLTKNSLILCSSQLPVGSIRKMENFAQKAGRDDLHFACSPENLRLGLALECFSRPERIVCGIRNADSQKILQKLFAPLKRQIVWMKVESAEMTKHSINAFLATSIAFANEIAELCEYAGADAKEVEQGMKTERRIGADAYVGPGMAFAGGTLARDLVFLSTAAAEYKHPALLLNAAFASNARHKTWIINKLQDIFGSLQDKTFAVWGLTYKPGTNTLRRSAALELAASALSLGAHIRAHDPSVNSLPEEWSERIFLASSPLEAAEQSDALVLCTAWDEYRQADLINAVSAILPPPPLIIDPVRFMSDFFQNRTDAKYITIGFNSEKARYNEY
jgi:UDPglucose 6-dehydrogenase